MAKLSSLVAVVAAVAAMSNAALGDSTRPMRVINITSDSAPGWLPSTEQDASAQKAALDQLAAEDSGDAKTAFADLADLNKRNMTFDSYSKDLGNFNTRAGAVIERRIVKVTWTKDPAQAPVPGVYAAIDIVSRFKNIDRHCGYVAMYQSPAGGPFLVMREETAFIDNNSAAQMEQQHGRPYLDQMWAQLSSYCPNYPGLAAKS